MSRGSVTNCRKKIYPVSCRVGRKLISLSKDTKVVLPNFAARPCGGRGLLNEIWLASGHRRRIVDEPSGEQNALRTSTSPQASYQRPRDQKPASKEATAAVKLPPSPAATEKALARIKAILGSWFCAEVKARNLIQKPEEIVQFAKLTDAQMLEIGPLLKRGWTFVAAIREVVERLTPDDAIRALHTRAVENGGNWCLFSVGNFGHVVVWGAEKDKHLAKVRDTLARPSAPQRS